MSQFSDEPGAELRELFFETAQELLQLLNEEALKLEKQPGDGEVVRSIRRIVHTLKGDAAASGLHELSELAHELEDALATESASSKTSLAEVAFKAADTFAAMLSAYRSQTELPSTAPLRKLIGDLAGKRKTRKPRKSSKASSVARVTWTEYEKLAMQQAREAGKQVYLIRTHIDASCAMPIAARQLILKALAEVGDVLGLRPEAGSTESSPLFQLLVASTKPSEELAAKCHIPTVVAQATVEAVAREPKPKEAKTTESAPEAQPEPRGAPITQTPLPEAEKAGASPSVNPNSADKPAAAPAENVLRVDAERIDALINLVGELVIGKSMLQQTFNEFSKHHPKDAMRGRFADAMAFQSRVLNDLQRSVMKVRMVPVEQLFRRFPRMVRDVAKQCRKDVRLVLSGQDTDLDKGLLDAIAEPLTHLVRNAIGHGIESAEERSRSSKPPQGTIRLDAHHQGNHVVVEVSDDGRGIDAQKVKAQAVERGLLRAEEADRLSETEVLAFIFRPGFSTADEITEVSGRGVGLDVVQSVLQRLKGTVQVETRPGQGTTFRLQLPLTLAIIKALLFRVEQRLYAIPLNSVAEIARGQESDLHQVDGCEILQFRNQVLPIIRLGNRTGEIPDRRGAGKIFVLVISLGERKCGLLVNALEGEEELVIKALDDHTVETDLVSGASILGDGRVVLILNLAALVERFAKLRREPQTGPAFGLLLSYAERAQIAQNSLEGRQ